MPRRSWYFVVIAPVLAWGALACGFEGQAQDRSDLEVRLDSLADRLDALETAFPTSVELTPGSGTYGSVFTDVGVLTFSLDRVESSDAGTKVGLTIGNTTAATIEGLGATVRWGPAAGQQAESRVVTLARALRPGSWTQVTVQLDTVATVGVAYLEIAEVTHTGIVLR